MKTIIIGCLVACLAMTAPMVLAQGRPNPSNNRGGFRGGGPPPGMKWAAENMPNLYKLANDSQSPTRSQYAQEIYSRFRTWQGLRDQEKPKVQQSLNDEDAIFGFVVQLRAATEEEKPAILEKINNATRVFVEGILEDREAHIKKLQDQVNEQEQKLRDDRSKIDQLVASRVKSRFLKEPTTRPSGDARSNENQRGGSSPSTPPPSGGTLTWPEQTPP